MIEPMHDQREEDCDGGREGSSARDSWRETGLQAPLPHGTYFCPSFFFLLVPNQAVARVLYRDCLG
jgi:hypothetical protein